MTENPYEAPQTFDAPPTQINDAEVVRRAHISTEASIKSVGILYYLGGCALVIASIVTIWSFAKAEGIGNLGEQVSSGIFLALGIVQFIVGAAIRKFKPWSKIAIGILSGIGLLGFPIGTLINGYILILTFGKKGRMVFSQPYQEIIAATPHVKYKTSKVVWIVLGLVIAVIAIGIAAILLGS